MANTHSIDLEASTPQYLSCADSASLSITGDISLECWVKVEQLPSTITHNMALVAKWYTNNPSSFKQSYLWSFEGNDKMFFRYGSNGSNFSHTTSNGVAIAAGDVGVWVHYAVTVDVSAVGVVMYKNGSSIASTNGETGATSIQDLDQDFNIGDFYEYGYGSSTPWNTNPIDGLMDEVRVWNDIRSAAEISDNKSVSIDTADNLVGSWHLNNVLTDSSGNGNTLTNNGSATFSTDVPFGAPVGPANLKTYNGNAKANIKLINTNAIANCKSLNGNV